MVYEIVPDVYDDFVDSEITYSQSLRKCTR